MRTALVVAMALLGACTDEGDDGGGGGGGGTCSTTNDACAGETICVSGACVAAFPRVYRITSIQVTVPTQDPNGADWDASAGGTAAPDLFVAIEVNNAVVTMTPVVDDMYTATFAGPFNVSLIAGSSLKLTAYDEDLTDNEPAYVCGSGGGAVPANLLRDRNLTCDGNGYVMKFVINPQ